MKRFRQLTRLPVALIWAIILLPLTSWSAEAADAPRTPIQHFVVMMQESRSFDNYFGTYPGAEGFPADACVPENPSAVGKRASCVRPYHLQQSATPYLDHSAAVFERQYRGGIADGWIEAFGLYHKDGKLAMGYYDGRDLGYYWNLAGQFVLFDQYFSSAPGGSVRNHMYWVTGTPGAKNDRIPTEGWGDIPTIFDRLQAHGISWKFYVQNYDRNETYRAHETLAHQTQVSRVPLLAYARYVDNPELNSHIVDLDQYFTDLRNGKLPAVAFIAPAAASERAPGNIRAGQTLVRSLITELMRSSAWPSSAFVLTYSNWGGWYDHVVPPVMHGEQYGFRVPAILVSPYARKGYVDSTLLDHTSILKFIEDNYMLPPLAVRDAAANSLAAAFDFDQAPRPAILVSNERDSAPVLEPRRTGVYIGYSMALLLPMLIIVLAAGSDKRRLRGRSRLMAAAAGEFTE